MKSVTIVIVFFSCLSLPWQGRFWKPLMTEIWKDGRKFGWIRSIESAFWEVVNDELRAESREGFIHLSFFSKKNLTMFLNYEKLLSILEKCVFESALTFHFGKVCDAKLCY